MKREIKFTTNIFFEENLNDEEVSLDLGNFSLLLIKLAACSTECSSVLEGTRNNGQKRAIFFKKKSESWRAS